MLKYRHINYGEFQHEVYDSDYREIGVGYGRTKEGALLNFKSLVRERINHLQHYLEHKVTEKNLVEVDEFHRIVKNNTNSKIEEDDNE